MLLHSLGAEHKQEDGNDDATPAVEAADPVAERAGIESGGLTDLMAQLAALQNENSKLQEDIETTKSIIESAKPPVEEVPVDEKDRKSVV